MVIGNPITLGGGGGGGFTVIVRHCGANAIVTARKGGVDETAIADVDGMATFENLPKGVWTFFSDKFASQKTMEISSETTTSLLPSAYAEVEYIGCTGTQFINITQAAKTIYVQNVKFSTSDLSNMGITGNKWALAGNFIMQYGGAIRVHGKTTTYDIANVANRINNVYVDYYSGIVKINATSGSVSAGISTLSDAVFGVGRIPNEDRTENHFNGKIYNVQLLGSNSAYLLYLVPCIRTFDNVVGMFDVVKATFYTNSGTGSFIAGGYV